MNRLLHTPEGVRDIYNNECARKLRLQSDLHEVLAGYGYSDIETPTFEYSDVFSRDVGSIESRELYKFFDRDGNTLVLRPDMTPSIARVVSRYFSEEEQVIRLCYEGNTFINNSSYQGRLKENTQIGAELIGSDSAEADAEVIAMVVDCLKKAGLDEFLISVGQVKYFRSILKELKIDEETEEELRDFISNRNIFGVEQLLSKAGLPEKVHQVLTALPNLYGSVEVLDRAEKLAVNEDGRAAVQRLREIYEILEDYGVTQYISFDFSMLSRYHYYTGVFFRGYTFGTGDAVVKGGRYDHLLQHFGKDAPSIGFAAVIDPLLLALERQKIPAKAEPELTELTVTSDNRREIIRQACELRAEGKRVKLIYSKEEA
ncbi:MAG: ATP phosphoribosyltransferase regulatory subunit [Eubacteriales bacterium]|nr:ATP phosphoribosyltransferase regulatory subunit [Eubacteriales bacterium]